MAKQIEKLRGNKFIWNQTLLGITETAWNKIIHRGIKPIFSFSRSHASRSALYTSLLEEPKSVDLGTGFGEVQHFSFGNA